MKRLEYLKGYPEQILPTLKCVSQSENIRSRKAAFDALSRCLGPKLLEAAKTKVTGRGRRLPRVPNLISAQALPTCRKLGLVENLRGVHRLTSAGRRLLETSPDESAYKSLLAGILLTKDMSDWQIIQAIELAAGSQPKKVTLFDVSINLAALGIDACQAFDQISLIQEQMLGEKGVTYKGGVDHLESILRFLSWTDLILREDSKVMISVGRLNEVKSLLSGTVQKVKLTEFYSALKDVYDELQSSVYKSPFVPLVPELRNGVCRRLGIDEMTFASKLEELTATPTFWENRRILLSPHMTRRPKKETITIGGKSYYFLSMYRGA